MSISIAYVGPGGSPSAVQLFVLQISNEDGVGTPQMITGLPTTPAAGPSIVQGEVNLHVFLTCIDNNVYEFEYEGSGFKMIGAIPNVSSSDRTAVVYENGVTQLFFRLYDGQANDTLMLATRSGNGPWTVGPVANADPCTAGPAATMRRGAANVAYNSSGTLKVGYYENGFLNHLTSPQPCAMQYSPSIIDYRGLLYATFADPNANNLKFCTITLDNQWSPIQPLGSDDAVNEGPTTCLFDNEIFCFSQGPNNGLVYSIFALGSWTSCPTAVVQAGQPIGNIYFAPYAATNL